MSCNHCLKTADETSKSWYRYQFKVLPTPPKYGHLPRQAAVAPWSRMTTTIISHVRGWGWETGVFLTKHWQTPCGDNTSFPPFPSPDCTGGRRWALADCPGSAGSPGQEHTKFNSGLPRRMARISSSCFLTPWTEAVTKKSSLARKAFNNYASLRARYQNAMTFLSFLSSNAVRSPARAEDTPHDKRNSSHSQETKPFCRSAAVRLHQYQASLWLFPTKLAPVEFSMQ